jgi:hypothetical protein
MRSESPIQSSLRSRRWLALPAPVVVLVGAILFYGGTQRARQVSEEKAWRDIAAEAGLPPNATREQIQSRIAVQRHDAQLARRVRVAQYLGVDLTWKELFVKAEHLPKSSLENLRDVLIQEYGFADYLSLEQMKRVLLRKDDYRIAPVPTMVPSIQVSAN